MQCFICVTYMIIISTAYPTTREIATQHQKRSLFHDVIESLRIHSQLPEEINQNEDNNLAQNFERYGFENEHLQLPSDTDFLPRRNDRIAMPSTKYRFPKNLQIDTGDDKTEDTPKEEVVVYIETNKPAKTSTTQKPKKDKRPRPTANKNKPIRNKENEDIEEHVESSTVEYVPMTNTMGGQSQIGNRESQTVLKPTVIVNIRGTVSHHDSEIRLERKNHNNTKNVEPYNVFNINQEINLDSHKSQKKDPNKVKQEIKVSTKLKNIEEDMMMCETATWKPESNNQESRKLNNMWQILFSI